MSQRRVQIRRTESRGDPLAQAYERGVAAGKVEQKKEFKQALANGRATARADERKKLHKRIKGMENEIEKLQNQCRHMQEQLGKGYRAPQKDDWEKDPVEWVDEWDDEDKYKPRSGSYVNRRGYAVPERDEPNAKTTTEILAKTRNRDMERSTRKKRARVRRS